MSWTPEWRQEKIVNPHVYAEIEHLKAANPTITPWIFETYSQCFEDVLICQMFKALMFRKNLGFDVSYVEIGANHPVCTSSSYLIKKTFNVTGILVEPDPKLANELRKHRSDDFIYEYAVIGDIEPVETDFYVMSENEVSSTNKRFVENWKNGSLGIKEIIKVKTISINTLLASMVKFNPPNAYLLSIDVEGQDLKLLQSVDFIKYRPYIVQVEPSEDFNPGNTRAMIDHMAVYGYTLVAMNFVNLIFQDKSRS